MQSGYDWLRRSRTGAELLATLKLLQVKPGLLLNEQEIGPPHSALDGPCRRCWTRPRKFSPRHTIVYCAACQAILNEARDLGQLSRQSALIWAKVNRLPQQLTDGLGFYDSHVLHTFVHDEQHWLAALPHRELKPFLQELVLYHGDDLGGLLQVFPTVGMGAELSMADALCRVAHYADNFPMRRLQVRFYGSLRQLIAPRESERKGLLTFDIADFLSVLEMVSVFRTVLLPDEQQVLHELLSVNDPVEEQFYWGRLMGVLNQTAKDMLNAWNLRQWPKERVKLLYDLMDYVVFYSAT